MKLHLTWRNIVAFLLFALVMGECHEVAHFIAGKIICGCWPVSRDFNAWSLCESCEKQNPYGYWPTFAGPVFSMTLAWVGMFLLHNPDARKQSFGFALIWANVPQARIMTVLMQGGDERLVIRKLTAGTAFGDYFLLVSILVVFIMAGPPIVAAFRAVKNRLGWVYNLGFMILPLVVLGIYGFFFLNTLLEHGFLAQVWIMGTPLFITLHTALALTILLVFFRKDLFTLSSA